MRKKYEILKFSKEEWKFDAHFAYILCGMGFSSLAVFAGVFEMVARGAFGFVFVPILGYPAACFASPAAWIMADIFLIPAYFYCINKLKKRLNYGSTLIG